MKSETASQDPSFWVKDIPIYGDVILAPMASYSDVPCRAVSRAHGSSMNYTEFVASESLLGEPNPHWRRLDIQTGESPMVFQIFGNDAHKLLAAAQRIEEWEPHIIDINMGCSVKKVSGRGAGVGMMAQPKLVADTFRLLSTHLNVPVTGKIRLGLDQEQLNYLEIAKIMEDNGASLVAMHGRTKAQRYNFKANWDAIGELKQSMSIPVIGNGDVRTPEDVDAMKAHTGCDGVMVGRGAVGNPWVFGRKPRRDLTFGDVTETALLHLRENIAYYGLSLGMRLFHRHLHRYFKGWAVKPLMRRLKSAETLAEFEDILLQANSERKHEHPQP